MKDLHECIYKEFMDEASLVVYTFNARAPKAEAGSLCVQYQPGLYRELLDSQDYIKNLKTYLQNKFINFL